MVSTSLVCREIQAHDDDFMESTFSFVSKRKILPKNLLLLPIYPTVKGRRNVASGYGGFNLWDTGTEQQCNQGTLVMEVWKNIFNINVLRKL